MELFLVWRCRYAGKSLQRQWPTLPMMFLRIIFLVVCFLGASWVFAGVPGRSFPNPFYVGFNLGYGSTTWAGLVPDVEKKSIALSISTPTQVNEGGVVLGGVIGFEFTSVFAIEANYLTYPDATIYYDKASLFAFEHKGQTDLRTETEAASLMGKFMVLIPGTVLRAYSSIGIGNIHRKDGISDTWWITPSFGAGVNVLLTPHIMVELVGNYMAGYGKSEINPIENFIPFLYAGYLRLAYRM